MGGLLVFQFSEIGLFYCSPLSDICQEAFAKNTGGFPEKFRLLRREFSPLSLDFPAILWYAGKAAYCGFKASGPPWGPPGSSETKEKAGKRMFAVIETGGKQYKVQYGDVIFVEKLNAAENDVVEFPVVALFGEGETKVGAPYVQGASVTGKVVKNGKAKKITVFTYKPKKNSKRKMGHRQPYTKIQIEAVKA